MTKYILHGGETGIPNHSNAAFYQEWAKGLESDFQPTILLVYFSRPEAEWRQLAADDQERFALYNQGRKAKFLLADNSFLEQIKSVQIIYVRGGSTGRLLEKLAPFKERLLAALQGKIYAGSSAGVMALSHLTRSNMTDWQSGLGLIPINSFVHYSAEFKNHLDDFQRSGRDNGLEYLLLPETEFVVREY